MIDTTGLPLSLKLWLATDNYDANPDPKTISATSILRPIKSLVLSQRVSEQDQVDLVSKIPSAIGTAIHTSIEEAWLNPNRQENLKRAGIPDSLINKLSINGSNPSEDSIPIYMEIRSDKKVDDWTVTGKFDFVSNGTLEDFKSTSVWTWIFQSNNDNYIKQGSIYRWLRPDLITEDYMYIRYIFTDWSRSQAAQNKDYPQARILSKQLPLMSVENTEYMVTTKLRMLEDYKDTPEQDIPDCTDDELWRRPSVFKYYKNPEKRSRSTKNFDTYFEAQQRFIADGSIGVVEEVKGTVEFCKYCPAVSICKQAAQYIADGSLTLNT